MRILGLDPGSRTTGYGILDREGQTLTVVDCGQFTCAKSSPLVERLAFLAQRLEELTAQWEPEVAVLESPFLGQNTRSLVVLSQARGALLSVLGRGAIPVHEYAPAEIKSAVTGSGKADKTQVGRMVRMLLGPPVEDVGADAADALAAAICYAHRQRFERLASGNPSRP